MSALQYIHKQVIPVAYSLLPEKMRQPDARAMLLAIGLQESRFEHRKQIGGPARGFWQFERGGGVAGVLGHYSTQPHIVNVLEALQYSSLVDTSYQAIADNDVLACVFARLLLYTHPKPLPGPDACDYAWEYYIETWRPGKPHRHTWDDFYKQSWLELQRV